MRQPDYSSADPKQWNAVDTYFTQKLAQDDTTLTNALASNADAGLPIHDVSALQGQMIAILVQIAAARCVPPHQIKKATTTNPNPMANLVGKETSRFRRLKTL